MLAFVVSGGELKHPEMLKPLACAADIVLAADSGYDHLLSMGVRPQLLLGDLDSISSAALDDARAGAVQVETYPTEKDYTDTELVLREALKRGATTILAGGVFGLRVDHMLANVMLLAAPALRGTDVRMLDERQEVRLVRGRVRLRTEPGEIVSLIPVGGHVTGVSTAGLHYRLAGATLETGPALGVSNVAVGEVIEVSVAQGHMLLARVFAGGLDAARYLRENPPE